MVNRFVSFVSCLSSIILAGALSGCAGWERLQTQALIQPRVGAAVPLDTKAQGWETVSVPSSGGTLEAWWLPAMHGAPDMKGVVLFLHGATVDQSAHAARLASLRRSGYGVLAANYRGFGQSSAMTPTEASLYDDAEAAWGWLNSVGKAPAQVPRIVYGHGLGGAVATALAGRLQTRGLAMPNVLVLENSPTSAKGLVQQHLPVTLPLLTAPGLSFDSEMRLKRLKMPTIVVHSAADEVAPAAMAQALFDAAAGPKWLIKVPVAVQAPVTATTTGVGAPSLPPMVPASDAGVVQRSEQLLSNALERARELTPQEIRILTGQAMLAPVPVPQPVR